MITTNGPGLQFLCCCLFLWLGRSMLASPWTQAKRVYHNAGLHMQEVLMWLCTLAAVADLAWTLAWSRPADADYDILSVTIACVFLNSICTSYAAHMNLTTTSTFDPHHHQHHHINDDDERTPFADAVGESRAKLVDHGVGLLTLVRCLFIHNAAMFLAHTAFEVALFDHAHAQGGADDGGGTSRRAQMLLGLFVVWYRGWQATFWFHKHNFPHTNVMLPRYDGASVHLRSPHLHDLQLYAA